MPVALLLHWTNIENHNCVCLHRLAISTDMAPVTEVEKETRTVVEDMEEKETRTVVEDMEDMEVLPSPTSLAMANTFLSKSYSLQMVF